MDALSTVLYNHANFPHLSLSLSLSDINECEIGTNNCHADAQCIDTVGSFYCSCLPGFRGDGVMTCAGTEEYLFTAAAALIL